ncbi:MAG: DUF485 domain-containing protein [Neisseria sp.]|uniref:DUF485 domain-containing protein n=1 Tax=Neisseria sp. TaxID=192066 RepID=UPI0026DB719A|nr:DUF485 domain-containing protein [Neisseria sp.]MDO4641040.1 DUF485 domain-containing protein [Neisseria sp.]
MDKQTARRVLDNPEFQKMARQKALLGWSFSAVILLMYLSYIWIIGDSPELLKAPVSSGGITTWGIYVGIFVIVFSFITTGIYVMIANGKFEKMTKDVVDRVMGDK